MVEMVIPMEDLNDPMPIRFTFKVSNLDDAAIWVKSGITGAPAGWNLGADEQHGTLGIGIDDYFLNDNNTRDKPADGSSDSITLRITYYSDAGYSSAISFEEITYDITYVDFTDVRYAVVDDDTFETGVEGWALTNTIGTTTMARSVALSRTGVASLKHGALTLATVSYLSKSFTISGGGVAEAYIRFWINFFSSSTPEVILEIITDAGEVSNIRTLPIAMDYAPKGGTEMISQWLCIGAELPVNGTFQVRLRAKVEVSFAEVPPGIFYDDIRVVEV